jgi:Holliday junction DNA helicase RuvA
MIASLYGRILEVNLDSLVVETAGIGYQVFVPAPLRDQCRPGDQIRLLTQMIVRQDLLALYGFESKETKELFSLLLSVEGIGPKLALGILSFLSPDAIRRAVFHEQPEVFNRVPGVGKKTAQKILLQLQDKIDAEPGLEPVSSIRESDVELLEALTGLGYSIVEAQSAIQSIPRNASEELEERLRIALQYFSS